MVDRVEQGVILVEKVAIFDSVDRVDRVFSKTFPTEIKNMGFGFFRQSCHTCFFVKKSFLKYPVHPVHPCPHHVPCYLLSKPANPVHHPVPPCPLMSTPCTLLSLVSTSALPCCPHHVHTICTLLSLVYTYNLFYSIQSTHKFFCFPHHVLGIQV